MMFRLNNIIINNFRSYKGAHEFTFPTEPGLFFFGGQNLVEGLGSNGAGKSTFLDAIVWCLYGKTTRGLKSGDISTDWSSVACTVTLNLTVMEPMTVKRSHKPNGLWLNNTPVDQQELEKHIRLNFESFMHSVLNAQFGNSFFSLLPSVKLELFSDIMNLDYWVKKSEKTVTESEFALQAVSSAVLGIAHLERNAEALKEGIKNFTHMSDNFEQTNLSDIASHKLRIKKAKINLEKLDVTDLLEATEKELVSVKNKIDDYLKSLSEYNLVLARFEGELKATKLPEPGTPCPTCHTIVNKAHAEPFIKKRISLIKTINGFKEDISLTLEGLVRYRSKAAALRDKITRLNEELTKAEELDSEITRLEKEVISMKRETNPFYEDVERRKSRLAGVELDLAYEIARKDELLKKNEVLEYWIKGFKKIRLTIIEQAFESLEVEVNNSLAQLGMPDWQISFDIERENKSGGITKGFVVFVKSPKNKLPVKWENWSGGETQRLQLAGDLGLSNLIMTQAGLVNTIEVFDEPSGGLSTEGMLDLANLLHERAIAEGKCIWIVDHAAISNFGDFAGTISVRKDENGSQISRT